jgi:hypothetical protein
MLRRIARSAFVKRLLGSLIAGYLDLVRRTSSIVIVPGNAYAPLEAESPAIITFWHGQHLMQTYFRRPHDIAHVMISRHGDGEINAIAVEKLGMRVVRGSGAQRADQVRKRGGVQALRAMLKLLEQGHHVAMTADVPKISRVCGEGIVTLAQISGRPVFPIAVVSSWRIDFASWDAASLGLPFGRIAIVVGNPVRVGADADDAAREAAREAIEAELDRIYALAYQTIGGKDPGAGRASVMAARLARKGARW